MFKIIYNDYKLDKKGAKTVIWYFLITKEWWQMNISNIQINLFWKEDESFSHNNVVYL